MSAIRRIERLTGVKFGIVCQIKWGHSHLWTDARVSSCVAYVVTTILPPA